MDRVGRLEGPREGCADNDADGDEVATRAIEGTWEAGTLVGASVALANGTLLQQLI